MNRSPSMMFSAIAALLFVASSGFADETKIPIQELPKSVLRAAQKAFPEAEIVGASKETEDGETMFEVEMKQDGKTIDLEIDDEGEVETVEKEIEAEELPKAVTRAVSKLFPKTKLVKVEEVSDEDDMVVYELTFAIEGKENLEVVFSPNGKIMKDEDDEDEDDEKEKGKEQKKAKDDEKGEIKPKN